MTTAEGGVNEGGGAGPIDGVRGATRKGEPRRVFTIVK